MNWKRTIGICGLIAIGSTSRPASAVADFAELLLRVPREANTLVLIDVDKLLRSPLATREGWKEKLAQSYVDTPMLIPPDAGRLVLAASIDLSNWSPAWEVAAMDMTQTPSIAEIARAEKGHLDSLVGAPAAWTPHDAYFVELSPRMMGVVHPAKRQFAARWVDEGKNRQHPTLSHFLHAAAEHSNSDEITMALDLEHAMSPGQLLQELEQSKSLQNTKVDLDTLSRALSSVTGVTLRVRVKEKMIGDFAVHFHQDVSMIKDFAKPLLLEFLGAAGASVRDFEAWQLRMSPKGTIVSIEGPLSDRGLRRLMSVVELPSPHRTAASPQSDSTQNPAEATQKHFQAVSALLDDLMKKESKDTLGHQDMIWCQRYARKIDRLPLLNVDPDMQAYSGQVSSLLMQAANALEGARQAARAQAAAYHPGNAYYGLWGTGPLSGSSGNTYYHVGEYNRRQHFNLDRMQEANRQNQLGEKKRVWAEQQAQGTDAARQILTQIDDLTAQVRTEMTDRYHINF